MRAVTMTKDMRPWRAGDRIPLPDDVADRLVASGDASDPSPWPGDGAPFTEMVGVRPDRAELPAQRSSRQRYQTKG